MAHVDDPAQKKPGLGLVAVALVSTVAASACCVLPLILVLLGIGGAWMVKLTAMAPATPFLIAIALLTFGWAGYLIFRQAPDCAYPQAAGCERNLRIMRRIYLLSAPVVAVPLLIPLIAPYFY